MSNPEPIEPQSRAEAAYKSYKKLVATGKDIQKRGSSLLLHYAGVNPKIIKITYPSGKAAKHGQMLLRRELRPTQSDQEYNRKLDAFLRAIVEVQVEREMEALPADIPAEDAGQAPAEIQS